MAVDKRDFKQSCIKAVRREQVSKHRATPILKRLRYTKSPDPLSSRNENLPIPRRLYFDNPNPLKNRIHFYNKVQVVYIPSRDHYPESMKSSIWSNMAEIQRNARRNTIEFASEGWDWRKACEDEAMYISAQGERIHPVHIHYYRS